jgi:hypothetical protein
MRRNRPPRRIYSLPPATHDRIFFLSSPLNHPIRNPNLYLSKERSARFLSRRERFNAGNVAKFVHDP